MKCINDIENIKELKIRVKKDKDIYYASLENEDLGQEICGDSEKDARSSFSEYLKHYFYDLSNMPEDKMLYHVKHDYIILKKYFKIITE